MLQARYIYSSLLNSGYDFFSAVPCSALSPLIEIIKNNRKQFIMANNEGDAIATCSGAFLGGKKPVFFCQNSGLTNAISPLVSLSSVFDIPMLGFVSLRHNLSGDVPQHEIIGGITEKLLDTLNIEWSYMPDNETDFQQALVHANSIIDKEYSYCFIVKPNTIQSSNTVKKQTSITKRPLRTELLNALINIRDKDTLLLSTTGYTSRDLFVHDHQNHFYMVGSMGCLNALAFGLSYAQPKKKIIAIDGDGAALMRLGAMATTAHYNVKNLLHIILDNEMHASTGGQATASTTVDFKALAKSLSYEQTLQVETVNKFIESIEQWKLNPCLTLLTIKIDEKPEAKSRPTLPLPRIKDRFMHDGIGLQRPLKNETTSVYFDKGAVHAQQMISELNKITTTDCYKQADIIWLRTISEKYVQSLKKYQAINHIPMQNLLTCKGMLARILKSAKRMGRNTDQFFKETYTLNHPDEVATFLRQLPDKDSKDNLWILKPFDLAQGQGVKITWQFDELKKILTDQSYNGLLDISDTGKQPYIAQRYIKDVLLLDKRKSELRMYWLIASLDPLMVLIHDSGTVRTSSESYTLSNYDNPLIHMTNIYQQNKHSHDGETGTLQWSTQQLEEYLIHEYPDVSTGYMNNVLLPKIKNIVLEIVNSTNGHIKAAPNTGMCYGLLGLDIMLDKQLNPWLTEVQFGPGLLFKDKQRTQVINSVTKEAIQIVSEVRQRKMHYESLKHIDAVSNYQWVINEAE